MNREQFLEAIDQLEASVQPEEVVPMLPAIFGLIRELAEDVPAPLLGEHLVDGAPIPRENLPDVPALTDTIQAARRYVDVGKWARQGVRCPACARRNTVDPRRLDATFVRRLVSLYMLGPGWYTCGQIWSAAGDPPSGSYQTWSIGSYWGLIEAQPNERNPTRRNTGTWRVTQRGIDYIHRDLHVPQTAFVYQSRCLMLGGPIQPIDAACQRSFDYQELMNGYADVDDPWEGQFAPEPILMPGEESDFYSTYLRSPEWYAIRARVLGRADGICERCHTRLATQAHHLTYARLGHERLEDLQAVCVPCHTELHSGRA